MSGLLFYINAIGQKLDGVARTSFGETEDARHRERPRYVWLPALDQFEGATGRGKAGRQIKNQVARCVVKCIGRTFEEAEMLRASLATATGEVRGGHSDANYRLGPGRWRSRVDNGDEWVCEQQLDLVIAFSLVDLPPEWSDALDEAAAETVDRLIQ